MLAPSAAVVTVWLPVTPVSVAVSGTSFWSSSARPDMVSVGMVTSWVSASGVPELIVSLPGASMVMEKPTASSSPSGTALLSSVIWPPTTDRTVPSPTAVSTISGRVRTMSGASASPSTVRTTSVRVIASSEASSDPTWTA